MKLIVIITVLTLMQTITYGQVHWLINADSIPNCELIKNGKFVNKETDQVATDGYYIVFSEGYATEYVNHGEYYLKSKIEFLSDCKYKSTVQEVTIPNYSLGPGTIIYTEVINTSTADNPVQVRSTLNNSSSTFVLEKIE